MEKYLFLIILFLCLILSDLLKRFTPLDNKTIPTFSLIISLVLGFIVKGLNVDFLIVSGICGLGATGLHQLITQYIKHPKAGGENSSNYEDGHENEDPEDADPEEGEEVTE